IVVGNKGSGGHIFRSRQGGGAGLDIEGPAWIERPGVKDIQRRQGLRIVVSPGQRPIDKSNGKILGHRVRTLSASFLASSTATGSDHKTGKPQGPAACKWQTEVVDHGGYALRKIGFE